MTINIIEENKELKKLYQVVADAKDAALHVCKPGVFLSELEIHSLLMQELPDLHSVEVNKIYHGENGFDLDEIDVTEKLAVQVINRRTLALGSIVNGEFEYRYRIRKQ